MWTICAEGEGELAWRSGVEKLPHNGQVRIYPSEDAENAAWISRTDYGVTRR